MHDLATIIKRNNERAEADIARARMLRPKRKAKPKTKVRDPNGRYIGPMFSHYEAKPFGEREW